MHLEHSRTYVLFSVLSALITVAVSSPYSAETCKNSPTERGCWGNGFDINTDYYESWPNGTLTSTREYWLSIENTTLAPDGTYVDTLTFNGTIPGPTLYADWGDTFLIHVTNNLEVNGSAIHWHGVRQLYTNQEDGVAGVTQCPQPPGSTRTYKFIARQAGADLSLLSFHTLTSNSTYGSTWYHSHLSVQYGAGLSGSLVINGPATMNYDVDLGPLALLDWLHGPLAFATLDIIDDDNKIIMDSTLLNGTNKIPCNASSGESCSSTGGHHLETTVKHGKSYRLRLISVSVSTNYRFTIDCHTFWIIANDLVPVEPMEMESIVISEGQRYDIVFRADQPVGTYWMRAIFQDCEFVMTYGNRSLAILRYEGADMTTDPSTTNRLQGPAEYMQCNGVNYTDIFVPWISYDVGAPVQQQALAINASLGPGYWTLNGSSFLVNWENPTALSISEDKSLTYYSGEGRAHYNNKTLVDEGFELQDEYDGLIYTADNIIFVDSKDEWVYFYLNEMAPLNDSHPIHLHGHDFWILSQGPGYCYPGLHNCTLNTSNPPRRDVAALPASGHLVIAFKSDNPGVWIMHCHIAWHASEGFAVQFVERKEEILQYYDRELLKNTCETWDGFVNNPARVWGQDDSGI